MSPLAESVVLNARSDAFVRVGKDADRGALVTEAVERGRAYSRPVPRSCSSPAVAREEIAALVDGLSRNRLTVISVPGVSLLTRELQELGVARVSAGSFTQRLAALTALQDAAQELLAGGALAAGTCALN